MKIILIFSFIFILSATLVHSQHQPGFISIDCGSSKNFYGDPDTGINYAYDGTSIDTGKNANISLEFQYPNNPILPLPLSDLKYFPIGNKNCYSLKPDGQSGSLNLIRASFLYGNYDGFDSPPEFDLYIDVNFWTTVKFRNSSETVSTEIINIAESDTVHVCLLNKGLGIPFISALELRPLNSSVYGTEFGVNASLVLHRRFDLGAENGTTGRYKDDEYDRVWSRFESSGLDSISTSLDVINYENGYRVPMEVIRTAVRPRTIGQALELGWNSSNSSDRFYVFMHFAELERNGTRKFDVDWNGNRLFSGLSPKYLYATSVSNSKPLAGEKHRISISATADSTLPPILNGLEIYELRTREESRTHSHDVYAITDIKRTYRITTRNWAGDPCGPRNYSWEGLQCSYFSLQSPRILSLNLTSSNLTGIIISSISKLPFLRSLDLSNNELDGPIPESLNDLKYLNYINLKGNQLSGVVPKALMERFKKGSLALSVDSNNLCGPDLCKKKSNNIVAPVLASLASSIVVILIALLVMWKLRRKSKSEVAASKTRGHVAIKKSQFSYTEVVEITNNFKREIGKGGFGPVYHGSMKDGTQVAVKMLSSSSSQGPREFQTEAELLMRIHHRNLAAFVGYCDDNNKLALIYEFMTNGNLKEFLAAKSSQLTWEMRLRIAVDAAQGLEYLHNGCKPGIVHRDVKTANILLGEKLDAKIADFGLSKVFAGDNEIHVENVVMGTAGYLDPEYYRTQKLNEKSDVFSFGVVLLELITGKPAIIKIDETVHVIHWVRAELEEAGDIRSIIDQRLQENFDVDSVTKALEVAMASTTLTSEPRATMEYVLSELKYCLDLELSKDTDRSTYSVPRHNYVHSYHSTPELSLIYCDSMSMDSITMPIAR